MKSFIIIFSLILFIISCSSKEIVEQKNENYSFDVFEEDTSENIELNEIKSDSYLIEREQRVSYYIIQIGAFKSEQRAKKFAEKSKKILNEEIVISFSNKVNLFLVQLSRKFYNKNDAEIVRDNLRLFPDFSDAWIITIFD
jgi:hypothetical protein